VQSASAWDLSSIHSTAVRLSPRGRPFPLQCCRICRRGYMKRAYTPFFMGTLGAIAFSIVLSGCNQQPVNYQKQLQEQLIKAKAGDVIEIPEGKFQFDRTLSLTADKVTIRGKGMDKSILSFAGQKEGGSGMLVKANDFVIENMAIEDTAGDGLTIQGGTNITVRSV